MTEHLSEPPRSHGTSEVNLGASASSDSSNWATMELGNHPVRTTRLCVYKPSQSANIESRIADRRNE